MRMMSAVPGAAVMNNFLRSWSYISICTQQMTRCPLTGNPQKDDAWTSTLRMQLGMTPTSSSSYLLPLFGDGWCQSC